MPYNCVVSTPELLQFSIIAILCTAIFIVTVIKAGRQQLNIRYATGWMLLSLLGVLAAGLIPLVSPIANFLGVTPGVVVFASATCVLLALTMQLSASLSGAVTQTEILAIQHAIAHAQAPIATSDSCFVVIPALNEAASIGGVVKEIVETGLTPIVIDDGSIDSTGAFAEQAGAIVLRLPYNLGVGAAVRCGLRFAIEHGATEVIQCDADDQHPVSHIPSLLHAAQASGADLVIGSRFVNGTASDMELSSSRKFAMRVLSRITSRASGSQITDSTSGFRYIRAPLLTALSMQMPSYYLGDTFETYVAAGRAGYRITEIHTPIRERASGVSSASVLSSILMLAKALLLTSTRLGVRLPQRPSTDR